MSGATFLLPLYALRAWTGSTSPLGCQTQKQASTKFGRVTKFMVNSKWRWSLVGIATSYGLDGPGFQTRQGQGIFHFTKARPSPLRIQPLTQGVPGSFTMIKRPQRETEHSPPPSSEVKNEWSSTSYMPSWHVQRRTLPFYWNN
jgi:hypothetical protein